jgi:predicted aspartyl protease
MHWTACFEEQCIVHYDGKLEGGYFPRPLRNTKAPRWETDNLCLAATKNARHLKVDARILNQPAEVMVDSGATGNFMHPEFMKKLGLLGKIKAAPQPIAGLNGENLGTLAITTESGTIPMVVLGHVERLNFDIVPMGRYDVVLGIPWLRSHNLAIDWSMN